MSYKPVRVYKQHPDQGGKPVSVISADEISEMVWGKKTVKEPIQSTQQSMEGKCECCLADYEKSVASQKFCVKCRKIHSTRRQFIIDSRNGKKAPNGMIPDADGFFSIKCDICLKIFKSKRSTGKRCSDYCKLRAKSIHQSKGRHKERIWDDGKIINCIVCNKEFKTHFHHAKICPSDQCKHKRTVQLRREKRDQIKRELEGKQ